MFDLWADYGFVQWEERSFVLYLKLRVNEPQYSVGHFEAFRCSFLSLEVFGDDDSQIPLLICSRQLLIGHVIVALHVVVSDVHETKFIYMETHLPLVFFSRTQRNE